MSLGSGRSRLTAALKELHVRWDRIQPRWNDKVRTDFEEEFIEPLERKVRGAIEAMEEMEALVSRARRECG